MLKTARLSNCADAQMQQVVAKVVTCLLISTFICLPISQGTVFASDGPSADHHADIKKTPDSLYADVFDNNVLDDNLSLLDFKRLGRKITGAKLRSANVNIYDEVADSAFFTNRKSRAAAAEAQGPDVSGALQITGGHLEGLRPVFEVRDSKGEEFTLYFDTSDTLGLMTSAMKVASGFYHAIGYNVPDVSLISIAPDNLTPGENSRFVDSSGFNRKLTKEKLDELVLMIPWADDGKFRVAAVKTPDGVDKGPFRFKGRRKKDPNDTWPHEQRRELRALRVFASWLNDFKIHDQFTRSYEVSEDGKTWLKHYLLGFQGALGADADGVKPPMVGYEYLYDAGETQKAFWTLGFWEKPWQKRWREAGEATRSSAVGYFDNNGFDPGKFKTFLPQFVFKDVTAADGFWAAKIIKSFTDEEIRSIVKTGKFAEEPDQAFVADTLIARRDIIVKYWFSKAAPLDDFDVKGGKLTFTDLEGEGSYEADVRGEKGGKSSSLNSNTPSFDVPAGAAELWIRKVRAGSKNNPYVRVKINANGIAEVAHQD